MSIWAFENQEWIVEYDWLLEDGRDYNNPEAERVFWLPPPLGLINKVDIPEGSVIYQECLGNEMYYIYYKPENCNNLIVLGKMAEFGDFTFNFKNNFNSVEMIRNHSSGIKQSFGHYKRNGKQPDKEHTLAGSWGSLPSLIEFKIIKPKEFSFYLVMDKMIPGWAIRNGTYLFIQTGDKVFESESSFTDGKLRIEIIDDNRLLLTPLYTFPGERKITGPILMRRAVKGINFF
jgi:hypothetical protein